jgi:hypothetical protein
MADPALLVGPEHQHAVYIGNDRLIAMDYENPPSRDDDASALAPFQRSKARPFGVALYIRDPNQFRREEQLRAQLSDRRIIPIGWSVR